MLGGGDPTRLLELARAATGVDGSAIRSGSEALVAEAIEAASTTPAESPWALAIALTVLFTPGVESPAPVV
jgi:hypothetical protein